MSKPKYRYNWKNGEWDELFTFNALVHVITGITYPATGIPIVHIIERSSPMYDVYLKEVSDGAPMERSVL